MKHLSLFSGIGGFDLAAQWMGWENMAHCEINPFCRTILNYYWPKAISYEDIKTTDFSVWRGVIDIVTGGFPCQPFSLSGARKGTEDDRHLWPEMLRAIREIQPSYIVGENVYGLFNWDEGMVFEQVQIDLEAEGYEVQPVIIPACAIGAPHRRDRIWFVAYASNYGCNGAENRQSNRKGNNYNQTRQDTIIKSQGCGSETAGEITANSDSYGQWWGQSREIGSTEAESEAKENKWEWLRYEPAGNGSEKFTSNADGFGLRRESNWIRKSIFACENISPDNWKNFPTQSPVCNGNDGISSRLDDDAVLKGSKQRNAYTRWRNESIKAAGNAIVPQVAYQIFKAIEATL